MLNSIILYLLTTELAIFEITEDSNLCQEIKIGDDYTVNNTLREIMVTLASLTPSVAGVDSSLANGNITVLDNDGIVHTILACFNYAVNSSLL